MTKRFFENDVRSINKKPKLDDDIDALWGDELDDSVFDIDNDVCIKNSQASQGDNGKVHDSFLPPYNVFKVRQAMVCSTQMGSLIPTTSNQQYQNERPKNNIEVERLMQQCEEKDGEIAILRSQLREVKTQTLNDNLKFQAEWKNKLSLSEKQIQAVKSELEFKDLEIGNLKQKVLSLAKHKMNMTIIPDVINSPKPSTSKEVPKEQHTMDSKKLFVKLNTDYPLKSALNDSMFTVPKNEKIVLENKLTHTFKPAIPFLQNKTVSTRIIVDKCKVDLQSVYPIIIKLCQCTTEELNCTKNNNNINEIICTGLQSAEDLLGLLMEIKKNLRTEDLLEADSLYLKNEDMVSDEEWVSKDELGLKSAFILEFLSKLLPYSIYLKDYIINNKTLDLHEDKDLIKKYPYLNTKPQHKGEDFLNRLITILRLIGEIRKANVMSNFLKSTIKLFTSVVKLDGYTNLSETVCNITKELIFLRPWLSVTFELTYLFREASRYTSFVQFLLNKSKDYCHTSSGVIYFKQDACRFHVFVLIFDRCLSKKKMIPLEICLNMLSFIYNTYKSTYFLHHQDIKVCECLPQLYKLEIELIFRMLEKYTEEVTQRKKKSEWGDFFNNRVVLNVLNLMVFHCDELTAKYINVYSQFKEIERRLNENEVCDLDRLNINDDIPEIDSRNFDNIEF